MGNGDSLHLHVSKPPKEGTPQYSLLKELEAVRSHRLDDVLEQLRRITDYTRSRGHILLCLPPRWLRVSIQRSSSPWSTRKSTWLTTCWRGSTNVSGSAACPPSLCPTCPRTGWLSAPASWTCGQCPPPLATERESPLLGGFITASLLNHQKIVFPFQLPVMSCGPILVLLMFLLRNIDAPST